MGASLQVKCFGALCSPPPAGVGCGRFLASHMLRSICHFPPCWGGIWALPCKSHAVEHCSLPPLLARDLGASLQACKLSPPLPKHLPPHPTPVHPSHPPPHHSPTCSRIAAPPQRAGKVGGAVSGAGGWGWTSGGWENASLSVTSMGGAT